MASMDITECKLCFETFDEYNRPRVLLCGHSFCTNCLDQLIKDGNLSCPRCKKDHKITAAKEFPVNYDLEESLSDAIRQELGDTPQDQPKAKITNVPRANTQYLISEAKMLLSQLNEYDEFVQKKKMNHEKALEKIQKLASRHEVCVAETVKERHKITASQKIGEAVTREMQNLNNDAADTTLDRRIRELEEWIDRCGKVFPATQIVSSEQVLKQTMDALSMVTAEEDGVIPAISIMHDMTLLEKVTALTNQTTITIEKLKQRPSYWEKRIASGQLFAISSNNGRNRSARLSEWNGKIYLHHLQDQDAPPTAQRIEHCDLLNYISPVAFIDLAWGGSPKGRVHIRLSANTSLGNHFRSLCTGVFGPSYARTNFHSASNINKYNECVRGGDYEYNNGKGGKALFGGIDLYASCYRQQWETGIIYASPNTTEEQRAQFTITTGPGSSSHIANVFGKITDGMEVLKMAAKLRNITEVEIIDCGALLSLWNHNTNFTVQW